VLGNVDAGKSTILGVLTQGELDNGRGRARLNLFRHLHEIQSGRTSSISHEILGFNSKGEVCQSTVVLIVLLLGCIECMRRWLFLSMFAMSISLSHGLNRRQCTPYAMYVGSCSAAFVKLLWQLVIIAASDARYADCCYWWSQCLSVSPSVSLLRSSTVWRAFDAAFAKSLWLLRTIIYWYSQNRKKSRNRTYKFTKRTRIDHWEMRVCECQYTIPNRS